MISAALRKYPALVKAHKARAAKLRAKNGKAKRKRNSLFGASAAAKAKRVKRIVRVQERDTKEAGEVIQVLPGGWLKVKWDNRQRPTLIKRSEIKRYPYVRNPWWGRTRAAKRKASPYGKHLYIHARVKPEFSGNHDWFLVADGMYKSKVSALVDAKKTYRESYDPKYLPHLEWAVSDKRKNPGLIELAGGLQAIDYLASKVSGKKKNSKRNPSIAEMSKRFQGRATGKTEEYYASDYAPRLNFSRGGKLVFLKLKGTTVRVAGAVVAIDPKTEKLWIAGSDARGLFKRKAARKGEVLDFGEIDAICYLTAKQHIGSGKTYEYVHEFGEEGGRKPHLLIDYEGMPIIKGGSYKIRSAGIID